MRRESSCFQVSVLPFCSLLWPEWPTNQVHIQRKLQLWYLEHFIDPTTDDEWFQISQPFSDWILILLYVVSAASEVIQNSLNAWPLQWSEMSPVSNLRSATPINVILDKLLAFSVSELFHLGNHSPKLLWLFVMVKCMYMKCLSNHLIQS